MCHPMESTTNIEKCYSMVKEIYFLVQNVIAMEQFMVLSIKKLGQNVGKTNKLIRKKFILLI